MTIWRRVAICAVPAVLWGCGGGGGGGTTGQNALVQGRAGMNAMASGQTASTSQSLQQILDLFLQALRQDPNSAEAHFGAAVCLAGKLAGDLDGNHGGVGSLPPAPPPAPGKPGSGSSGGNAGPPSPPSPPGKSAVASNDDPGETVPVPPGTVELKPIPKHRTLGLLWNLDNGLANPYNLLHLLAPISDLRYGFAPYFGYPNDNAVNRQKLLDGLNTVADHLAKVEADPNFSITLPDVDSNGKSVTVGLPEVYLFDAYVQSLRAKVALSLAYVRDPGTTWSPPAPQPTWLDGTGGGTGGSTGSGSTGSGSAGEGSANPVSPASQDKNGDGKLTPDEYLPASPYLTLRDSKVLQTAQQAMLAVVDQEGKGIAGVLARPAEGSFLVPNVPAVQNVLGTIRDRVLPVIQQAATGPFTIEVPVWFPMHGVPAPMSSQRGDTVFVNPASTQVAPTEGLLPPLMQTEELRVNLAAWFANPPADLKAFAPTLSLGVDGWPSADKTVYPDKTFGGLFPDGLGIELPF